MHGSLLVDLSRSSCCHDSLWTWIWCRGFTPFDQVRSSRQMSRVQSPGISLYFYGAFKCTFAVISRGEHLTKLLLRSFRRIWSNMRQFRMLRYLNRPIGHFREAFATVYVNLVFAKLSPTFPELRFSFCGHYPVTQVKHSTEGL